MKATKNSQSLLKATLLSVVFAGGALALVILPAEYGIDPTGVGEKLGLTVFNDTTTQVSKSEPTLATTTNIVSITIPAGKGLEYKLAMEKFAKVTYQWKTEAADLYVDLHGEPYGDKTGYFESYAIATVTEMKGSFTTPFKGSHGWYWKNNSAKDIQVELSITGDYVIEGIK